MFLSGGSAYQSKQLVHFLFLNVVVDIGVAEFVAARAAELELMYEEATHVQGNARIMQRLPRHMRRRAASHNIKRLPANIRAIAQMEVCCGNICQL